MTDFTRESILVMEADPELDALVVERVMGWVVAQAGRSVWQDNTGAFRHKKFIPQFSTDIAAAWEVVEHLYDIRPCGLGVEPYDKDVSEEQWVCHNGGGDINCATILAFAPTAPLAICRAALLTTLQASH